MALRRRTHRESLAGTTKKQSKKFWAFMPLPGESSADKQPTDYNLEILAQTSIIGIAHTRKLAKLRRNERAVRLGNHATSEDYGGHVFDAQHPLGAVAIIGYAAKEDGVPHEWHIERYTGKSVEPTVSVLPIEHTINGVIPMGETLRMKSHLATLLQIAAGPQRNL